MDGWLHFCVSGVFMDFGSQRLCLAPSMGARISGHGLLKHSAVDLALRHASRNSRIDNSIMTVQFVAQLLRLMFVLEIAVSTHGDSTVIMGYDPDWLHPSDLLEVLTVIVKDMPCAGASLLRISQTQHMRSTSERHIAGELFDSSQGLKPTNFSVLCVAFSWHL